MLSSSILKNMSNICHTLICFLGGAEKHSGKISGVFFLTHMLRITISEGKVKKLRFAFGRCSGPWMFLVY